MSTTLEQPAPTFNDVWRMFQETDRQMKATALQIKETDQLLKERSLETDRKFQETGFKKLEPIQSWLFRSIVTGHSGLSQC